MAPLSKLIEKCVKPEFEKLAFLNCNLIDVVTGNVLVATDLLIQNGVIVGYGPGVGRDAQVIVDASGLWAIPGLIDLHVHICDEPNYYLEQGKDDELEEVTMIRAFRNLSEALDSGITTVRDAGSAHARSLLVKRAVEEGVVVGPTVYCCGHILTYSGGHMSERGIEVQSREDIRKAIELNIAMGADYIKVASDPEDVEAQGREPDPSLTVEDLQCIVTVARANGMKVACHTYPSIRGIQRAIEAGIDTLEHAALLEGVQVSKDHMESVTFIPTLVSAYDIMRPEDITAKMSLDLRRAQIYDNTNSRPFSNSVPHSILEWFDRLIKNLPKAISDGNRIAIGSDAGCLGTNFRSAIREMFLLSQLGATNLQVLQFATVNAAEALGVKTLGRVEIGYTADIVFCGANPIENLDELLDIKILVSRGVVVKAIK